MATFVRDVRTYRSTEAMILSCRLPVHRFRLASDSGVSLLHDCSWAGSSLSFFIRSPDSSGRFRCGTSVSMLPEAFCSDKNITFVRTNWPGMDMEDDFGRSWRQDGPAEGPSAAVPERERQPDPQPVRPPSRFERYVVNVAEMTGKACGSAGRSARFAGRGPAVRAVTKLIFSCNLRKNL